jgi:tetratricopeptide (TPR) repeat protein
MSSSAKEYYYPGSRPFEDTDIDRKLFFGREQEKEDLLQKVLARKLVVLFAKSGLGKTSLINAGISEGLRQKRYVPIKVRFNDETTHPLKRVYDSIQDSMAQTGQDWEGGEKESLWQYFKTAAFWSEEDALMTPVLILDQFEEFFTFHKPDARKEFIQQLADLEKGTVPTHLQEEMRKGESFTYGDNPPQVKILVSIREDCLGLLDELSAEIPDILLNRYRLAALTRDQARDAITKPPQVDDERIGTQAFTYAEDALDAMLDYLSKHKERKGEVIKDEVESFQLQLLCRYIESNIKKKKNGPLFVVKKEDLGGEQGMYKVLQNFYENQVSGLNTSTKINNVRRLCENGLISVSNRRLSLEEEEIERQFEVSASLLTKLVDNRLLRAEKRVGSVYYELSHDSLITPIRLSQKASPQENKINKRYKEAREAVSNGNVDIAIGIYKEILDINKTDVISYLELGQLYNVEYRRNDEVELYRRAIDSEVNDYSIYTNLGKLLFKTGEEEEALEYLKKAIALNPEKIAAYEALGDLYAKKKDFSKAIQYYKTVLGRNNKIRGVHEKLAVLYVEKGEFYAALEIFECAINIDVNFAGIYEEIGLALKSKGEKAGLEKLYEIALNVKSEDADYYFGIGYDCAELGKYDAAIASYKKALLLKPDDADAHRNMGVALDDKGDYDGAIASYKKALQLKPDDADAHHNMGISLRKKGDYEGSIASYKKALQLKPDLADAHHNMGVALDDKGDYDGAIASYKKALEVKPDHLSAKENLAELYLIIEDFDKTLELSHEVLKAKGVSVYQILAMHSVSIFSLFLQGKPTKAHNELKELITYYRGLTKEYEREWDYTPTKNFITKTTRLNKQDLTLLLQLIHLLDSPINESKEKLKHLEALMKGYE